MNLVLHQIIALPCAALELPLSFTQGFGGASDKVTVYDEEDQLLIKSEM